MKWRWAWSLGLALALSGVAARGQDSLRAFGLEFTVISNAVMAVDDVYAALKVVQVGGPECYYPTGTNDIEDLPFGVSVHLGEAQSGVYVYPNADCRADGRSMWANAYGAVNGETNQLISSVKGTRISWGNYGMEVDLTPLGATSYTYEVWSHGVKMLHATNQGASSGVNTLNVEDYDPRVNPVLLTEAGPAVVVEFPNGTQFGVSAGDDNGATAVGDRMLIIAEGATNHVSYVSRVDVFGSADLPSFAIEDARIGMFGRPHKALGGVNFTASSGRLGAGPFRGASTNGPTNGILVDFKKAATRWLARTEPFALAEELDAQLLLSATGLVSSDNPYARYWGPAGFTRSNGVINLSADFSTLGTSNSLLRVFRGDSLSGSIFGASGTALASLTDTNPMVTGWAAGVEGFTISVAESTRVTGHDGTLLEGDRFEFVPHESASRIGQIYSANILADGIPGITILSEFTEEARIPELRLQIERATPAPTLVVSWPYHPMFYLVEQTNLINGYTYAGVSPTYEDFKWHLPVNPTNTMSVYSLRYWYWYYTHP